MKKTTLALSIAALLMTASSCRSDEKTCLTLDQANNLKARELALNEREQALNAREASLNKRATAMNDAAYMDDYAAPNDGPYAAVSSSGAASNGTRRYPSSTQGAGNGRSRRRAYAGNDRRVAYEKPTGTPGFYPESSMRVLTTSDVEHLSLWGATIMLNEIYARHGMRFADARLQKHFNEQNWYQGTKSKVSKELTGAEKQNIALLNGVIERLKAQ